MTGEVAERSHYHYRISVRIRHPSAAPQRITEELGIQPWHFGKADERRRTPKGTPLNGFNSDSFWMARVLEGRWPSAIGDGIHEVLASLAPKKAFLHALRSEGGTIELFIGWFFENQSGDVLSYQSMALAGDLQVNLLFDVYPPDQPQAQDWV